MTRPKKATVDFFPHYVVHGETMFNLEAEYGNDGYSFWFKLLELLGKTDHHFYDCNKPKKWRYLLSKTRFSDENANKILNLLAELEAIDQDLWKHRIIWSVNFISNLEALYSRREINPYTKSEIESLCIQKLPVSGVNVDKNTQSRVEESRVEESKGKERKDLFEHLWGLYPRKKGKGQISDAQKTKIFLIGQAHMERCLTRFTKDMEREGRPIDKYPYGSTFFNSAYVDYLDENYEEDKKKKSGKSEEPQAWETIREWGKKKEAQQRHDANS